LFIERRVLFHTSQRADPFDERQILEQSPHRGELGMCMRVDESGQQCGGSAEVDVERILRRWYGRVGPDCLDAAGLVDEHGAVADRRRDDRQDPAGAVTGASHGSEAWCEQVAGDRLAAGTQELRVTRIRRQSDDLVEREDYAHVAETGAFLEWPCEVE